MGINTIPYTSTIPIPATVPAEFPAGFRHRPQRFSAGFPIARAITAHYHKEGYTNFLPPSPPATFPADSPAGKTSLIKATAILITWN